ncbi:expressed protein [Phakopsora pachyrhizi]|uniref:Expressed protein n=1 Tax=Phakopsora pachyrhizi TaxID=170000 RepID=A0AAV0ASE8_PHAPC|nr:expressed protein [Phakopsora pachyrhizi]
MEAISKRQSLSPEAESDLGKKITKTKDFQAELRPSVRKSSCLSWVNNAAKDFKEKPQAILTFPETDDHADSDTALVWPSNDETAFNSVAIYYGDLKRLKDGEFLNDTLIEFGLKWELKQLQEKNPPLAESIHLFNSFFYQKLSTKSKQKITASDEARLAYDGVRKWTKGLDVFKKKYLIIPINEQYVQRFSVEKQGLLLICFFYSLHWYFMIVLNPGKLLDQNMLPTTPARPNPTIYQPRSLRSQKFNNSEIEGPKMTPNSKVRDFDTNQKSRFFVQSSVELLDGVEGEARGFVADHHISDDTPTTALQQMDIDDQEDGNIISEARCSDKDFFEDSPIFLTLDSLGNPHRPQSQLVIRYLINEAQDKLNTNLPESILKSINVRKVNVPAQPNYCDCGLYLIHAFKRFFENPQKMVEWILDPTKNKKKTNEKEVEDTWDAAGASKARKALRETIHNLIPAYQKKEKERKAQRLKKVPQNDQDSDLSSVPDSINMDLPLDKDEVEEFMHSPLHDAGGGFSVVRSGSLSPGYRSHILKRKVDKCESFKTHEKPCAFEHIKSLPPEQKKKDDSVINIPDSPIQKGRDAYLELAVKRWVMYTAGTSSAYSKIP